MSLSTIIIKTKNGETTRIIGAVPTENNYTDAEKSKLSSLSAGTQDLSGLQKKIIFSETEPINPAINDIWIDTSY
jgi:hypothetical protein